MFSSFRFSGLTTAFVMAATITSASPSGAAGVTATTSLENAMDTMEAILEVTDNNSKDKVGTRTIHLSAPTIK